MERMPSVMNHNFSEVPKVSIPRSTFDRSHGHKTTFDAGYLVPIYVDEALPGDTFNLNMSGFGRLATPIFPIMDNMYLDTFFFAVPLRLIWDNFQKFMGEQEDPGDSTDFLVPVVTTPAGGFTSGSLYDYFGLPVVRNIENVANLHGRAYNLIYNEWFRDENIQDSVTVDKGDGPDSATNYVLRRRGKRHDYFTSCLPWPQKADSAVTLPLGIKADIAYDGSTDNPGADRVGVYSTVDTQWNTLGTFVGTGQNTRYDLYLENDAVPASDEHLYADLSTATAATINQIREAFQIQRLYERDARGGTRYTEIVRSHFGVTSPDARLQRPEYLGGRSNRIMVNPIAQTSSTDGTSPQGNLAAMGTVSFDNNGFTKSFTEHCVIIGLINVRADLTYQQGIPRMFSRQERFDFYFPSLAHLGEQAVLTKEIFATGASEDQNVFGYQERYAEYRYKQSTISGIFRSDVPSTLDPWHLSQAFITHPVLTPAFIEEDPPIDRVIATPSEPHFIFDSFFKLKCARPMPTYGVPGMVDHF